MSTNVDINRNLDWDGPDWEDLDDEPDREPETNTYDPPDSIQHWDEFEPDPEAISFAEFVAAASQIDPKFSIQAIDDYVTAHWDDFWRSPNVDRRTRATEMWVRRAEQVWPEPVDIENLILKLADKYAIARNRVRNG